MTNLVLNDFFNLISSPADINDCVNHTCANGGTCVDGTNSYLCKCVAGFSGNHCQNSELLFYLYSFYLFIDICGHLFAYLLFLYEINEIITASPRISAQI